MYKNYIMRIVFNKLNKIAAAFCSPLRLNQYMSTLVSGG